MEIKKTAHAGRIERGDLRITLSPGKGKNIEIKSSIRTLYGDRIEKDCIAELERLGIQNADVLIEDDGALEYVIAARVEAAVVEASEQKTPHKVSNRKVCIQPERLRRSRLYIPGNNPALFPNAWLFGADMLLLDLEDAVPPAEKFATRYLVRNALLSTEFGESEIAVRINPLSSPFGMDDLAVIVPAGPDVIVLPKAESAQDIVLLKSEIARIQKEAGTNFEIAILPIIESALGVIKAPEIASVEGVVMLAFGAEDFTKDIGAQRTKDAREQFVARSTVVLAAKAHGKMASDTVFSDLADEEGLIRATEEAKALGFDGRGLIHPGQVEIVHKVFAPTEDELIYAVRVINAAQEAERKGSGVVALGRKMIDPPVVSRAHRILGLAEKMKMQIPKIEE
jgi:citrate lyase subunit beta/citryl-CoA lyase